MRNAWLEEAQAGIKIAGRNINNLRYADDTILMAESEELLFKEPLDESEIQLILVVSLLILYFDNCFLMYVEFCQMIFL